MKATYLTRVADMVIGFIFKKHRSDGNEKTSVRVPVPTKEMDALISLLHGDLLDYISNWRVSPLLNRSIF
jgi:hypothetical protein